MRGIIFVAVASLLFVACATPIEIPDDPLEGNTVRSADGGFVPDSQSDSPSDPDVSSSDQGNDSETAGDLGAPDGSIDADAADDGVLSDLDPDSNEDVLVEH